jgi:hypothetical protein
MRGRNKLRPPLLLEEDKMELKSPNNNQAPPKELPKLDKTDQKISLQ